MYFQLHGDKLYIYIYTYIRIHTDNKYKIKTYLDIEKQ